MNGERRDDVTMPYEIVPHKAHLPHPYNLDLSGVLHGLNRRTPWGHRRAANDMQTAAYLRAAEWLIQRNLGPDGRHDIADPGDPHSLIRPLLSFLSQQAVTRAIRHIPLTFRRDFRRSLKVGGMRRRWKHQSDYVADVLRFMLWAWHYPAPHMKEMAGPVAEILRGADPVPAIHQLCAWDLQRHMNSSMFRLSLVASAQAEEDEVIHAAIAERNRENGVLWKDFYQQFLDARGLRMRDGVTLDDCVTLFSAMADGLALRALAEPGDADGPRGLLGKAALALILSCTESAGSAGPSIEEAVAALLASHT